MKMRNVAFATTWKNNILKKYLISNKLKKYIYFIVLDSVNYNNPTMNPKIHTPIGIDLVLKRCVAPRVCRSGVCFQFGILI